MIGFFVRSKTNDLGVGKNLGVSGQDIVVEYFKSVGERIRKTFKVSEVERVRLPRQTRCYVKLERDGRWQLGRIGFHDDTANTYEVLLPGGISHHIPEPQLYVRCSLPVDDPIETLILKGQETPYFSERRGSFVRCLIEQQSAARGMTGLISSNIDLYPHQLEVVRRVLEDPVQRYLLADEVGLGKTIEAGVILRQYLLDEPDRKVLIFVPALLKQQWQEELEEKFHISEADQRVYLAAVESLDGFNDFNPGASLGLIIIDEAHHIAAAAFASSGTLRKRFEICRKLAHHVPGLLLLSATPALNNEQAFLAMLHLLDPTAYQLGDLEAFTERLDKRQEIGHLLLSFYEGAYTVTLKRAAARLRETFPIDARLSSLLDALEPLLSAGSDELRRNELIRTIRVHISDSYRLHRRMLRNRRDSVELVARLNPEQRRADFKEEYDVDERVATIQDLLEEWRVEANEHLRTAASENPSQMISAEADLRRIFFLLFRSSGTVLDVLGDIVRARLSCRIVQSLLNDFNAADLRVLCKTPCFDGEETILRNILDILDEAPEECDRVGTLVQALHLHRAAGSKVVVFTSYTRTCNALAERLGTVLGVRSTVVHARGGSRVEIERDLSRFKADPDCFVMLSDSSGEEGRNLQFADWVIHFDFPQSPNNLEQRIGRLDRIGRTRGVRSRVFVGPDVENGLHEAWYQVLRDGLKIFEKSVASLQFYIDKKFPELEGILFRSGAAGIIDALPLICQEIDEEQVRVNEQNALDEIDSLEEGAGSYYEALVKYDSRADEIRKATEDWICHALHFNKRGNEVVRYKPDENTLVPVDILLKNNLAQSLAGIAGTYRRDTAVLKADVHLLRVGNSFIDAMADYVRWDDRGQTAAIWRHIPEWSPAEGGEGLGFRFDLVAEADLETIRQVLDKHEVDGIALRSLSRRCDGLFPPMIHTVYVAPPEMGAVGDPYLLELLKLPFSNTPGRYRDYNLAKHRLPALERLVDPDQWEEMCRSAKEGAIGLLRESESFIQECEVRAERADRELGVRVEQLKMRLTRASEERLVEVMSLEKELKIESALHGAVVEGVRKPSIRVDSVGFYVISGRAPSIT